MVFAPAIIAMEIKYTVFWMGATFVNQTLAFVYTVKGRAELTTKLLKRIWRILAFKLVRPANSFCRMLIKTWPRGALMKAPYAAILGTLAVK